MQKKISKSFIITLLIVGVMMFTATTAFAGDPLPGLDITIEQNPGGKVSTKNYSSSLSNKSIGQVRMEVGNILLGYGVGGADINKVTDALEGRGVYEAELKSFLIAIGINEKGVQDILIEFDKLEIAFVEIDGIETEEVSTPDTGDTTQPATGKIKILTPERSTVPTPDTGVGEKTAEEPAEESAEEPVAPGTGDTSRSATGCENDDQCSVGMTCFEGLCVETPPQEGKDPLRGLNISRADKYKKEISYGSDTGDSGGISTPAVDSFFDVFVEFEVFIEVIANDANFTKIDAGRVIDTLMAVSPAFTIDENGLEEARKAQLVEAIASDANLTKADAKRALDAFVGAITKSAPLLHKALITGERVALVGSGSFSISKRKARTGRTKYQNIVLKRSVFQDASKNIIQNIRSAAPEERESLIEELRVSRQTLLENVQTLRQNLRENAQELRENFREAIARTIGHVDHGKTARIAVAHGKGLRMLNRFRSAIARFDHILGRIESRVEKLETRGVDTSSIIPLIEEAENTKVETEATMETLKAKYEELLKGENLQGIGNEAREIAQELKQELKNLHTKLDEIVDGIRACCTGDDYNSSRSNTQI